MILENLHDRRLLKVLGPAARVAVVHAVADVWIRSGSEQQANHLRVATRSGQVERRDFRAPARPAAVDICAVGEQPFHCRQVVALRHEVQRPATRINQFGILVQQVRGRVPIAQRKKRNEVHRSAARRTMSTNGTHELRRYHRADLLHDAPIGLWCTRVHRHRLPRAIHGQWIGAELEQQRDHLLAIPEHGEVQRRPVIFVATLPASEGRRIGRHETAHFVRKVHRDGGENVVPRAATHEKLRNGTMRVVVASVPARCPTDDLELVIVTVPDDITARVSQSPHHVPLTGCRGPVHRVGVVSLLAGVHVQAAAQQEIHGRQVSLARGVVQQRPLVRLRSDVQPVWMFVEQGGQDVHVAILCCVD